MITETTEQWRTAILYAHLSEGYPQTALWRDYTHLNDFGRLVAAYGMLVQLTGNPIESISVDRIPAEMRHSRFKDLGDLVLTEEMKQAVIQAANYSLNAPFTMPPNKTAE